MTDIMQTMQERICILSKGYSKGNVNALTYGDGKIRTYLPDAMDERVMATTPPISSKKDLIGFLQQSEPDDQIVATCQAAHEAFGWGVSEFDLGN